MFVCRFFILYGNGDFSILLKDADESLLIFIHSCVFFGRVNSSSLSYAF